MNNLIKISKLNKSFEGIKKINVLKSISYNFKKGKIYSLMGPSGSGKSTLLNLLSLIDRPSSGSIIFENKKINYNNTNKNLQFKISRKISSKYFYRNGNNNFWKYYSFTLYLAY